VKGHVSDKYIRLLTVLQALLSIIELSTRCLDPRRQSGLIFERVSVRQWRIHVNEDQPLVLSWLP
jgi:hypothetical protein